MAQIPTQSRSSPISFKFNLTVKKMASPDDDTPRESCPGRIIDVIGRAFGIGAVGGGAYHFLKGFNSNPTGTRLAGGWQTALMNAPRIGGQCAVWGGLLSAFECSIVYLRQKEDPLNFIAAGAATGGLLRMRQGIVPAARSALFGGVVLALMKGPEIMLSDDVTRPPLEAPIFVEDVSGGAHGEDGDSGDL
ncbi:hypothetical protein ABFX02_11G053900 [Erythranthe guttata]